MELSSFKTKRSVIFREMELSSLIFFLCFRKEYFRKKNRPEKISHIFSKQSFSYISGNGNLEKKSHIFQETELPDI